MGELAITMDCSSTDSPLADEACYFDGTHYGVKGFTALTIWMLQLALNKVIRLPVRMALLNQLRM